MQQLISSSQNASPVEDSVEEYQNLVMSFCHSALNTSVFRRLTIEDSKLLIVGSSYLVETLSQCPTYELVQHSELAQFQTDLQYDAIIFEPEIFSSHQPSSSDKILSHIESLLSENGMLLIIPPIDDSNSSYVDFKSYFSRNGCGIKNIKQNGSNIECFDPKDLDVLQSFGMSDIDFNLQGQIIYRKNSLLGKSILALGLESGFFNCGLFERSFFKSIEEVWENKDCLESINKVSYDSNPEKVEIATKIYNENYNEFKKIFYNRCRDWQLAEDAVNESFLRLLNTNSESEIQDIKAWILRVGDNWLIDHHRRKGNQAVSLKDDFKLGTMSTAINELEDVELVFNELAKLDKFEYVLIIFCLYFDDEMSRRDIAKVVSLNSYSNSFFQIEPGRDGNFGASGEQDPRYLDITSKLSHEITENAINIMLHRLRQKLTNN